MGWRGPVQDSGSEQVSIIALDKRDWTGEAGGMTAVFFEDWEERARSSRHLPVVLSRAEMDRLLAALPGR